MFTLTVSKEQLEFISGLCDVALKAGGLNNLNQVLSILGIVQNAKEEVIKQTQQEGVTEE